MNEAPPARRLTHMGLRLTRSERILQRPPATREEAVSEPG
jgi:hypothetical protein